MRWADLDQLGHVNNVVYVDYLQEARVDMLRVHGRGPEAPDQRASDALAEGVVVVRHEVTYLKTLAYDFRPVSIECWVTEIRAASFTIAYEVFDESPDGDRTVYLRATTALTPYLFAQERPRRLTPEERALLAPYLEPVERPLQRRPQVPRNELGHYPVHVRFSDVDVYGHVNNVKYFEYLQEARILLFRSVAGEFPRTSVVVAQVDVDYRRPILFRSEPYDCWTAITRVGARSMTLESEICDGDVVLAASRVVIVFFDLATNRSTEPDPAFRDQLMAALAV